MLGKQIDEIHLPAEWNDWEVMEQVGVGSYGAVYCARKKTQTDCLRAIKVIHLPVDASETNILLREYCSEEYVRNYYHDLVKEYQKEIDVLNSLKDCPNIVSCEDFCIEPQENDLGWDIYIRMEYLMTFDQNYLDAQMDESNVIRVGIDICTALSACHAHGIIHRDIKPDNILVSHDGEYKLGDFGVAQNVSKTLGTTSIKGTYSYMAPEVYKGQRYDNRADIYSLGLVLYRLMNRNREPFVSTEKQILYYKDREEALKRRMNGEELPDPIDASPELNEIIRKACAFDPQNRYQSADEMLADLILLRDKQYKRRKRKFKKRKIRKGWKYAAAVAVLAIVVACIGGKALFTNYNIVDQGSCGPDTSWTLYKDGKLVIQGTGAAEASEQMSTYASSVETVEVEEGVTEIGPSMFFAFEGVTDVELPDTVEVIGSGAFSSCYSLKHINLPRNLTEIADETFVATAIEELVIPDTVTSIGESAFLNGNLVKIDIPDEVLSIGNNAFANCYYLEEVKLSKGLSKIDDYTFDCCESLKSIVIPEHVEAIGNYAFRSCRSLETIVIPSSVEAIGVAAFESCRELKNVTVPESTFIEEDAFLDTAWEKSH